MCVQVCAQVRVCVSVGMKVWESESKGGKTHTTGAQVQPPFHALSHSSDSTCLLSQPCWPPLHGVMGISEEFTRYPDSHPLDYTVSFSCAFVTPVWF